MKERRMGIVRRYMEQPHCGLKVPLLCYPAVEDRTPEEMEDARARCLEEETGSRHEV